MARALLGKDRQTLRSRRDTYTLPPIRLALLSRAYTVSCGKSVITAYDPGERAKKVTYERRIDSLAIHYAK